MPWGGTFTAHKVTWRAVVEVRTISSPELSDGAELADTVLARLRHDHAVRYAE